MFGLTGTAGFAIPSPSSEFPPFLPFEDAFDGPVKSDSTGCS